MSPAAAIPSPHRSAIVARLRVAGCVFAEDEADLLISSAATPDELPAMVDRRVNGLPLEHILGWARFCGLRIAVAPGVFVPRARTEALVRRAAALATHHESIIVDLCCGSGAIGAAVTTMTAAASRIRLYAADIDPVAVSCARLNLRPFGGQVFQGDLYAPLPAQLRGRVDVLVANVPYVPTEAISLLPPEARLHEPRRALDGGTDGLDLLRRVAAEAPAWLAAGGHVLVETGEDQAATATGILDRAGLTSRVEHSTDFDATVVIGHRPAATQFDSSPAAVT